MPEYREKLRPSPWLFVIIALVIPASLLVFLPISMLAGVLTAAGLYLGSALLVVLASPTVQVSGGTLTAGRATIDTSLLGEAVAFAGADATAERGPRLDARAWLLIRGWVPGVVRIPLEDPTDPAPYWLVSSRQPQKMAAAINRSRRPASSN
ncbi:DUF3093 domain-containing protein [Cryobacterium sp. PAMC25264]|uniref:DUF3093 domain-containing protein n=1 Tax=Cryobacterium sp. PAMC25264 TaxID=2861288 RepID=UPI001C63AB8D|nr:DUF3093 domain-containing protein [Cryobacterium sp. PAMC25264]QYF75013.1 DUF3093 domain-containing protein [Cryobacterium sp. PAMC25264]